jgi:riboflavin synthase
MFTGLIEAIGEIATIDRGAEGQQVRVRTSLARDLRPGDSLAVNGVCLTVTVADKDAVLVDVGPETARVTTLGDVRPGLAVNLERAMRADSRFGGHFVQGHVDGVGTVREVRADGDAHWLTIAFAEHLAPYLVSKGSIAVDGVSLTIAALEDAHFDVMLIPFTWERTTLSVLVAGSRVNLECDMIGKYVARATALWVDGQSAAGGMKGKGPTTRPPVSHD